MNLFEDCQPLKKHIVHLFGAGSKALKEMIASQTSCVVNRISLERITFSREFVAVDFTCNDDQEPTVYLSLEEVQEACYPEPKPVDAEKLKDDFAGWSGGFRPEDDCQITVYLDHALDKNLDRYDAKVILEDWMNEKLENPHL